MLQPLLTDAKAVYPRLGFKESGARESRFGDPYDLFRYTDDEVWVPRGLAPIGIKDYRDPGLPVPFKVDFTPRNEEQLRIVERSRQLALAGESFVIRAPTGSGKTIFGAATAGYVGRRFLVITTKEDLFKNWVKAGKLILGLEDHEIGFWRGDSVPSPQHKMVIGLVQSILKGPTRYPLATFCGFGLVICDEVHRMAAEEFQKAMWWLPSLLRIGLSATPKRKDGKEDVFFSHIGPIRVEGTLETLIPKVIMKTTPYAIPRVKRNGVMVPMPHSPGKLGGVIKHMAMFNTRNRMLANFTKQAYDAGRTTVIFSDSIAHLEALYAFCLDVGIKPDEIGYYVGLESGLYKGKKHEKEAERERAASRAVILATYKMCSEGTDYPWWDTCVLGSPKADVEQIVGRIRREYPDKKTPVVFDPVDVDSRVFHSFAKKRLKWYQSLGCEVSQL